MKYINYKGVKVYYNFKLLFKGFLAIMLFGNIYCKLDKNALNNYLNSPRGEYFIQHEKIHILQAKSFKLKWLAFYPLYLWYWIINLFKFGFSKTAYYCIPFEREAYDNMYNLNYNETHWKEYK